MSEHNREQVSALVDDELSPGQMRRITAEIVSDARLREFWENSHLISAAMRDGELAADRLDLAARVHAALDSEPVILAPAATPAKRRAIGPLGGLALAASVMMMAIIATQQSLQSEQTPVSQKSLASQDAVDQSTPIRTATVAGKLNRAQVVAQTKTTSDGADSAALTRLTWNEAGPGVEARLNNYLLTHNEYMVGGLHGMLPYARVVGYGQTK